MKVHAAALNAKNPEQSPPFIARNKRFQKYKAKFAA